MLEEHDVVGALKAIETSSVDPAAHRCHGLYIAAKEGLTEMVEFYLSQTARKQRLTSSSHQEAKYDFSFDNPIVSACENNHIEIVKLMLAHPTIDPSVDRSFAVQVSAQAGMNLDTVPRDSRRTFRNIRAIIEATKSRSYHL